MRDKNTVSETTFRDYLLSTIIVDNFTRDKITGETDFYSKLIKKLDRKPRLFAK